MVQQNTAIVTGGNRGIGFQIVARLCDHGITTLFTSRNPHDGYTALARLKQPGRSLDYHPLDVSESTSVEAFASYVKAKYPKIDILINSAGTNYDTWHNAANVNIIEAEYTMSVNFMGPWRMCIALLPCMERGGRIINVSSGAGTIASQDGTTPAYSLSKNGLNMLTRHLAASLADRGITVNAADPGWVRTDMGGPDAPRSPGEGAATIVWLATREDNSTSGCFYRDKKQISW
ncbi:SDR family oxidoreductase [Desulforhopalus singaporensis]|uniref:NAD(P)-dependent dehydrogenase, short-chain alcohol dehydrogenase family n=1 Tax=Desulforhopalus singaporensis TaxID=91360 RepID=A0A1H0TXQ4_9BACT|nr:SDR family oxidoreductase [Desulforhopalus singaporensis]SDP58739.1 NAD(P)-dependent dehydrogenase, short-chain alcohol dehydrogenase family [Desulforhopalus singaporensis]